MWVMSNESKEFLKKNLPHVKTEADECNVLLELFDWIELHGYEDDDQYNDLGKQAQAVYDDVYYSNFGK